MEENIRKNENSPELTKTFEDIVEKEFLFLVDAGYQKLKLEENSFEQFGDSISIKFVNEKIKRNVNIAANLDYNQYLNSYITMSISKESKNDEYDYMIFDRLLKAKEIDIQKISAIRAENKKSSRNMILLVQEFARILREDLIEFIIGDAWIDGLYREYH